MKFVTRFRPGPAAASFASASTAAVMFALLSLASAQSASAQERGSARGFQGSWNWAVYAESKDDLPPAYRSMELREVPAYALDLTLRQRGSRVSGTYGLLARYLAKVDEGSFSARIVNGRAQFRLRSNHGGSATVVLTLRGDKLLWRTLRSSGENYFPKDAELRRLKPGEKLPYEAGEEEDDGRE
jgi:hypothetical protein